MRRLLAALTAAVLLAGCGTHDDVPAPGQAACAWHAQDSNTKEDLTGLSFPDDTHGWAVGGIDQPIIEATTDGGRTWSPQHYAGTNGLSGVAFRDDAHGVAVGIHNLVLSTNDGGTRWTRRDLQIPRDGNLYDVTFADARHGWIVGSKGLIRTTADGGATWQAQKIPTNEDLDEIGFSSPQDGWIVTQASEVFKTTDGGGHWLTTYTASGSEQVAAAQFLDATHGWVSGSKDKGDSHYGQTAQSTDGGQTWKRSLATQFDDVRFGPIAFTDALHGWVTGYEGELWYTDNGGRRWGSRPAPTGSHKILKLLFRNPTHGWGVGQFGAIVACTA